MNVLVVSLVVGGKVSVATRHTLTCAEKIAPGVDVLLIGEVPEDAATQVASFSGVRSVFVCQMASVGAEGGACQVKAQSEGYSHILFDAGTLGKAVCRAWQPFSVCRLYRKFATLSRPIPLSATSTPEAFLRRSKLPQRP